MVWVNLLPWRQVQLQKRWRVWRLAGGALVLVFSMLMLKGYWQRSLNHQQSSMQGLWNAALNEAQALNGRTQAVRQQLIALQRQQDHLVRRQQQMVQWRDSHAGSARTFLRYVAELWINPKELCYAGRGPAFRNCITRDRLREGSVYKGELGAGQRVRTRIRCYAGRPVVSSAPSKIHRC